ncbi:MAG: S8 family serine peptidase [Burkholderiales bacterium]|nr:S8 family serine peptidase [Burkholderiales bacterium]
MKYNISLLILIVSALVLSSCNNGSTATSAVTPVSNQSMTDMIMFTKKLTPAQLDQLALARNTPDYAATRKEIEAQLMQPLSPQELKQIQASVRDNVIDFAPLALGGRVIAFDHELDATQMATALVKISQLDFVQTAKADTQGSANAITPVYQQWYAFNQDDSIANNCVPSFWVPCPAPGSMFYGANFYDGITKSFVDESAQGQSINVAVIDTGYVPHPDFVSRLVKYVNSEYFGYNFISSCTVDGSCPATTPLEQQYQVPFSNAQDNGNLRANPYHGTAIISEIVGQGGGGVAGGAPKANLIPIRVMGAGLYASDLINAFLWAANLHPTIENIHPAKVISLSLTTGMIGLACDDLMQETIDQLVENNVVIAAASGNNSTIALAEPVNCRGVLPVAALTPESRVATYSNISDQVVIAAPGGTDTSDSLKMMYMANYKTSPYSACTDGIACFNYKSRSGTSFAAPLVAAAVADILSVNPNLNLAQIKDILTASAQPFSGENRDNCNKVACLPASVGKLDVKAAIELAKTY